MKPVTKGLTVCAAALAIGLSVGFVVRQSQVEDNAPLAEVQLEQKKFVAKIIVEGRGNTEQRGSGSLIREDLVLTNWHVVNDRKKGGDIVVEFYDGTIRHAKIVSTKQKVDLCVLRISPVSITPVTPGKPVEKGSGVTVCGFPYGKSYAEVSGKVSGWRQFGKNYTAKDDIFLVNRTCTSGMSGGPVLDSKDRIVGVLFGSDTYANCCELLAIREFLGDIE